MLQLSTQTIRNSMDLIKPDCFLILSWSATVRFGAGCVEWGVSYFIWNRSVQSKATEHSRVSRHLCWYLVSHILTHHHHFTCSNTFPYWCYSTPALSSLHIPFSAHSPLHITSYLLYYRHWSSHHLPPSPPPAIATSAWIPWPATLNSKISLVSKFCICSTTGNHCHYCVRIYGHRLRLFLLV